MSWRVRSRGISAVILAIGVIAVVAVREGDRLLGPSRATLSTAGPGIEPQAIRPSQVNVIDGDTISVSGAAQHIRLIGFNAPETYKPLCAAEAERGAAATRRLAQIVSGGDLSLTRVACSCPAGSEGTDQCNYGRACGILESHGQDVGSILIAENLAVQFQCFKTSCPPTPRLWCN